MSIGSIEISNIMVFQNGRGKDGKNHKTDKQEGNKSSGGCFRLEFCEGINVLIGENGVGKTTILKMIYVAARRSRGHTGGEGIRYLAQAFSHNLKDHDILKHEGGSGDDCYYKVSDGEHCFEDHLNRDVALEEEGWTKLNIPSVFIPTTEMLSHSKGFLALNQKYYMPFDDTQVDIIVNASLPETREISASMLGVLEKISDVIAGTVVQEEDVFYLLKKDGRKVEFSLEAEGLRKLGLLWKLIRNGLLESGSILLWDEPEANLNPELYPLVAEILLELERNGVQIFVATHSYNFAKYLEIRRISKAQVRFHNLYKESTGPADQTQTVTSGYTDDYEMVKSQSADRMEKIWPNHIMIADNKLLDEVYEQ